MSSWQPNACPITFISCWGSLRLLCLVLARLWKAKPICAFFVSWDKCVCVCESLVNRTLVLLLQNAKTRNQAVTCLTHQSAACQACFPVSATGHHYHKSNWTLLNFTLPLLRFGWVESTWHGKVQKETGGVVPSYRVRKLIGTRWRMQTGYTTEFLPNIKVTHFTFAIQCYSHICQMVSTAATQRHLAETGPSNMNHTSYVPYYWDKFSWNALDVWLHTVKPRKEWVGKLFLQTLTQKGTLFGYPTVGNPVDQTSRSKSVVIGHIGGTCGQTSRCHSLHHNKMTYTCATET